HDDVAVLIGLDLHLGPIASPEMPVFVDPESNRGVLRDGGGGTAAGGESCNERGDHEHLRKLGPAADEPETRGLYAALCQPCASPSYYCQTTTYETSSRVHCPLLETSTAWLSPFRHSSGASTCASR